MSDQYDSETSKHYASYRPPIHGKILEHALRETSQTTFNLGLDIGCGTGVSTEVLRQHCANVVGIDPSIDMLTKAQSQTGVSFAQGKGECIPLGAKSVDIVTFAGSLSYANKILVVSELLRVCRPNAFIVAYDFKVMLSEFLDRLGAQLPPSSSQYNHAENFTGFNDLYELKVYDGDITIEMSAKQLSHVLFSSTKYYKVLVERFGADDTFTKVVAELGEDKTHHVKVETYYSTYQVKA